MATATTATDVRVPDIGDFADVPIIEIFVGPGDTVAPEDPLVTLESDKATMDVPSPQEGVVQELKVNVGDTVSEGSVLLTLVPAGADPEQAVASVIEPAAEEAAAPEQPGAAPPAGTPAAPRAPPPPPPPPAPPPPRRPAGAAPAAPAAPGGATAPSGAVYASPGVR